MWYYSFDNEKIIAYNFGDLSAYRKYTFTPKVEVEKFKDKEFLEENYEDLIDNSVLLFFDESNELYYFYIDETITFYKKFNDEQNAYIIHSFIIPRNNIIVKDLTIKASYEGFKIINFSGRTKIRYISFSNDEVYYPINQMKYA